MHSPPADGRYPRGIAEFDRAIAFIDASIALALTLLITTLDPGDYEDAFKSLSTFWDAVGSQLITFAVAFAVIAGYWLLHHRMVAQFNALDSRTIVVNLLMVATIVLLPFSTGAVGDPETTGYELPTALMAVNIVAVSSLYTAVWIVACRGDLVDPPPSRWKWRERVVEGLLPAAVFLVSIPIDYLVSPDAARFSWLALVVLNPLAGSFFSRRS